jgi:hypothetical protein
VDSTEQTADETADGDAEQPAEAPPNGKSASDAEAVKATPKTTAA